jgi:NADH:ubiquinone oxidoreductase subunit E
MTPPTEKLRFAVCVNMVRGANRPCCGGGGSLDLLAQIEAGVRERHLNVQVERIVCLNKCLVGPNMRIIGGEIFSHVTAGDVPGILDQLEAKAGRHSDIGSEKEDDGKIIFPGA